MIRTQISMTPEQAAALRQLAAERRRSQASLMREALDALVAESGRNERVRHARTAIGRHESEPSRTAEEQDAVLGDAYAY